jgi:amino acid transporter
MLLLLLNPGEVDNPSRTFPRALLWAVLLVVASYFLPTLAALGITVDSADWELGYYGKVAQQVRRSQPNGWSWLRQQCCCCCCMRTFNAFWRLTAGMSQETSPSRCGLVPSVCEHY